MATDAKTPLWAALIIALAAPATTAVWKAQEIRLERVRMEHQLELDEQKQNFAMRLELFQIAIDPANRGDISTRQSVLAFLATLEEHPKVAQWAVSEAESVQLLAEERARRIAVEAELSRVERLLEAQAATSTDSGSDGVTGGGAEEPAPPPQSPTAELEITGVDPAAIGGRRVPTPAASTFIPDDRYVEQLRYEADVLRRSDPVTADRDWLPPDAMGDRIRRGGQRSPADP